MGMQIKQNSLYKTKHIIVTNSFNSNDRTSFFIGLPTETDNTFQQGQTSNTPITYEVIADLKRDNEKGEDCGFYEKYNQITRLMATLNDIVLSIRVQPRGMPPIVEFGSFDITSR